MALIWDDIDFARSTVSIERTRIWAGKGYPKLGPPKTKRGERVVTLSPEIMELLRLRREQQQITIEDYLKRGIPYGEPEVKEWIEKTRANQAHRYTDTNLVFPNRDGRMPSKSTFWEAFKAMLRGAGFSEERLGIRWHDLRHTHATFLLTMGIPDHEVAERLGHTVAELQRTYAHIIPKRRRMDASFFGSLIPVTVSDDAEINNSEEQLQKYIDEAKEQLERHIRGTWNSKKKKLT
jgi:integrase